MADIWCVNTVAEVNHVSEQHRSTFAAYDHVVLRLQTREALPPQSGIVVLCSRMCVAEIVKALGSGIEIDEPRGEWRLLHDATDTILHIRPCHLGG